MSDIKNGLENIDSEYKIIRSEFCKVASKVISFLKFNFEKIINLFTFFKVRIRFRMCMACS